ncbi:MAG: response regulator [Defluviitaleaceae bacterium]|nr:response regulator [Defluviitaleaceae bacterium]
MAEQSGGALTGGGKIATRFRNINLFMLVLILVLIISMATIMVISVANKASENFAFFYSLEAVDKFNLNISRDLALVQKVARSKAVTDWFADEDDLEKREAAYDEMMDYMGLLLSGELYFAINESLNEFSITGGTLEEFLPFDVLLRDDPYNEWYFGLLESENEFAYNIDIDKVTNERRIWINHKVISEEGIVGVFCAGLRVEEMLQSMFARYDETNVRGFVIDKNGEILLASHYGEEISEREGRHISEESEDPNFIEFIEDYLSKIVGYFELGIEPELTELLDGPYGYASVAPIANSDWMVVTFFNNNSLFSTAILLPLVFTLVSAFIVYTLASTILTRRLILVPLKSLTASVSETKEDEEAVFGGKRDDEFGELARIIQKAWNRFNASNAELRRATKDVEQRDTLLSAVNNAISLLLQAEVDKDKFNDALLQSMGMMANAVGADRVYIWKNQDLEGKLYCTQLYEWSEGAEPQQGNTYTVDISYDEHMPGWREKFERDECVNGIVSSMSPEEQEQLASQGIISILVVPVFLHSRFWGFVGFDDCSTERFFNANEESILRSGSLLIANALLRNEMTQDLESALDKAKAASQAKGNFLSNMSHEIRTPMNAIVGMTTIGKSARDSEKKDYAFDKIEGASSHLLGVINDVLDMSKIEANKFELSNMDFDFEKMLHKVSNFIGFRVNERSQKFTINLDPRIPQRLIGDDQRLAQVITNLLSNATKFTPEEGAIILRLKFAGEDDDSVTLKIEVSDTGIGISPEQQERLFISFEQAESSTSRKYGGTGLGLAISKRIIELMGGDIWIDSELGMGATFIFTVKLGRSASEFVEHAQSASLKGVRILVVDDEPETLEYFTSLSERVGYICETARNGGKALEMLSANPGYDICFVDFMMPEMDGIDLTRLIREKIPEDSAIIMISANDFNEIEREARSAGVSGFLPKPIFPSDIIDAIARHAGAGNAKAGDGACDDEADSFEGHTILLAEDLEINREIVIALLEPTKLVIECAVNGLDAVKKFNSSPERYDMIFMDLQMPEMDGLTATQHIRSLDLARAPEIPIVAMTANVFRDDVEKCLAVGMNDHIGKPIDYGEMLRMLRKHLQK